jgi:pyruvate dehydrogenase E1 component alpha subunit
MTNIIEIQDELKNDYGLDILHDSRISKILQLFYVRNVEEFIANKYSDFLFRCPVHLSIGQEAIAVGVCSNLTINDKVISTHRSHAHYLAKGGDLISMFAEMMGKPSGCSKGRGGSMHLFDDEQGFYGSIPIVGSSLPIATGIGYAQKLSNDNGIAVAFQGDAAFETGQFSESLNFISTFDIPILMVMENNKYSTYSPINDRRSSNLALAEIIKGYGLDYYSYSGDNLLDVDKIMADLIIKVRNGKPIFVEFDTFRRLEHCGPNLDDNLGYRTIDEIKSYEKRDPILIIKKIYANDKNVLNSIEIFEKFLPKYILNIYEKATHMENEHPLLTEQDCFRSI